MTEMELRAEHHYRYNERLAIQEVYGEPTADQHNLAVEESDEAIARLRDDDGIVAKLRNLRLAL